MKDLSAARASSSLGSVVGVGSPTSQSSYSSTILPDAALLSSPGQYQTEAPPAGGPRFLDLTSPRHSPQVLPGRADPSLVVSPARTGPALALTTRHPSDGSHSFVLRASLQLARTDPLGRL